MKKKCINKNNQHKLILYINRIEFYKNKYLIIK